MKKLTIEPIAYLQGKCIGKGTLQALFQECYVYNTMTIFNLKPFVIRNQILIYFNGFISSFRQDGKISKSFLQRAFRRLSWQFNTIFSCNSSFKSWFVYFILQKMESYGQMYLFGSFKNPRELEFVI